MDRSSLLLILGSYIGTHVLVTLKTFPSKMWGWFLKLFSETIELDPVIWENPHSSARKFIDRQKLIFKPKSFRPTWNGSDGWGTKNDFGNYYFWFDSKFIIASDTRKEITSGLASGTSKSYTEKLIFRSFFPNKDTLKKLTEEFYRINYEGVRDSLYIYNYKNHGWTSTIREKRDVNTVFLPGNIMEELIEEIVGFASGKEWYKKLGIPYHIGFLFHGEPGNGKSSAIKALASKFSKPIYKICLKSKDMDDKVLSDMFSAIAEGSIVVLEDIDCAFGHDRTNENGITLSGLLNCIDGLESPEDFILFMTTNHREKLDPALVRPGRIDREFYIGNAECEQVKGYFTAFYGLSEEQASLATDFAEKAGRERYSMAIIQNHLRQHKASPNEAVENWKDLS